MKTVVIFGGSGFIGQNIVRRLAKTGYRIIIPYQRPTNEAILRLYGNVGQIIPLKYKTINDPIIVNIINNTDIILNLKTIWQEKKGISYEKHIYNFNVNLVNLINQSKRNSPFFFFSGLGANIDSSSLRIRSIARVENYILSNLKKFIIIRPSIIIGRESQFLQKLLPVIKYFYFIPLFGSGESKIQPVLADDIAKAVQALLKNNKKYGEIYELTGPEIFTYKSFYRLIIKILELKRRFFKIPFNISMIGANILEKTPFNFITKEQLVLFKNDNISSGKYKNFNDLGIFPSNITLEIKKIILK